MLSFKELDKIAKKLCDEGYNSFSDFNKLNDENKLCPLIENGILPDIIKHDIIEILDLLFTEYPYHYKKKMTAHYLCDDISYHGHYALALYAGDYKAYYNFPRLLYLLIQKFDITKYKYLTLEDLNCIVFKTFDIKNYNEDNVLVCKLDTKFISDKYNKYDEIYDYNSTHCINKEEFSVWAEHRSFDDIYNNTTEENKRTVIWAAREYGDGYGYDIYCLDSNNKEMLVEVKSGKYNDFVLTTNEYKVMKNCHFHNAEYYIHKYTFNRETNMIDLDYYYYDSKLDLLVNQRGEYFDLYYGEYTDEYGRTSYGYSPIRKELEKTKTLS